jgi:hypothetical protein
MLSKYKLKSTWFVTHKSKKIFELYNDSNIEIGLHPNFNDLLFKKDVCINSNHVLDSLTNQFPKAKSVRSHSLTQNEYLIDLFCDYGLTRICNLFVPFGSSYNLNPYRLWNNASIIPHCYQDNISFKLDHNLRDIEVSKNKLIVLLIHPIHLFINTSNMQHYESCRLHFNNPSKLIEFRNKGFGIKDLFIEFLDSYLYE